MEKFKAINKDGKEVEFSVTLTFNSEQTNKNYIVCSDGSKDSSGNVEQYVFSYDINKSEYELNPITDAEEWKMVNEVCQELLKKD